MIIQQQLLHWWHHFKPFQITDELGAQAPKLKLGQVFDVYRLSPTLVGFIFIFNVNVTNLMSTSGAASMLFTESAQNGTNASASINQPRVDVLSEKRRQLASISHEALARLIIFIVTTQEHIALTKAADLNTIARITQIWADRLQLTSVYVSCQKLFLQNELSAYTQASFFTSIDSLLFSLASNKGNGSRTSRLMQASLTGALIFHAATGSKSPWCLCLHH